MHRHVTHNRGYATYNDSCQSVLHFLREQVPKNWAVFCKSVTDNFRVINPADFGFSRHRGIIKIPFSYFCNASETTLPQCVALPALSVQCGCAGK